MHNSGPVLSMILQKIRYTPLICRGDHAQEDKKATKQKAGLGAEKLRNMKLAKVADFVERSIDETLSYMAFPYEHWSRLRQNNGLERIMKEIIRRIRV